MMTLDIQATKSSPLVAFDTATGEFRIEGQSYPENPVLFYEPVLVALDEYIRGTAGGSLKVTIRLSYMNTSSSKCLMGLIGRLEVAAQAGFPVTIDWHFDADNEMAREAAEEFAEGLRVPFNIIGD